MSDSKDQGAIPQGLIEQARARSVDPGKLQLLGKQAAALHHGSGMPLSEAVVQTIGQEDVGPEHTRRICEFANQAAFQSEWEKGGAVRNIEFDGGPADPSVVLRDLNDGARQEAVRVVSDYDSPPTKLARANNVEEEIFGKFASGYQPHPKDVAPGMGDLTRLRTTIIGAQDHVFSKIASLKVTEEMLERDLGDAVADAVMNDTPLLKIAEAWSHFTDRLDLFEQGLSCSMQRMNEREVPYDLEKVAEVGRIPNAEHPLVSRFCALVKVASEIKTLSSSVEVLDEQLKQVEEAIKQASLGAAMLVPGLAGAAIGAASGKRSTSPWCRKRRSHRSWSRCGHSHRIHQRSGFGWGERSEGFHGAQKDQSAGVQRGPQEHGLR